MARSRGVVAAWAEAQRRQQRLAEAQWRAQAAAQRELDPHRLAAQAEQNVPSDKRPAADLMDWDPLDFEDLIAALFQQMGYQVVTTERTGDGGVDVLAMDPDPVTGGKLIIQVKRYRHTIPPAHVRDLYGTVMHEGASMGILVATSGFGPGARDFAHGKPIKLISGTELAGLLSRHGMIDQSPPARGRHAATPNR